MLNGDLIFHGQSNFFDNQWYNMTLYNMQLFSSLSLSCLWACVKLGVFRMCLLNKLAELLKLLIRYLPNPWWLRFRYRTCIWWNDHPLVQTFWYSGIPVVAASHLLFYSNVSAVLWLHFSHYSSSCSFHKGRISGLANSLVNIIRVLLMRAGLTSFQN
jgi:hypothetical protein